MTTTAISVLEWMIENEIANRGKDISPPSKAEGIASAARLNALRTAIETIKKLES